MNLFLDSSALVKLYHSETGTERLSALLATNADDLILTIADISLLEFHSAVLKRVRIKEVSIKTAKTILAAFENDLAMFNVVEVDSETKQIARELLLQEAAKRNFATLDALQLSAALSVNSVLPVEWFVTADKALLNIAGGYLRVFNPEAIH
jgi:predicted nucleic acid-binding protein